MTGRQLLMMIYRSKELVKEFNKEKLNGLMKDEAVIEKLNVEIEELYNNIWNNCTYQEISGDRPLMSYYRAVSIDAIEDLILDESEIQSLARKICHIVINKGRKTFFQNKNNQKYYDTFDDMQDMVVVEHLLFLEELREGLVNENGDYDLVVLDEDGKPELWSEQWGESDVMGF